MVVLRVLLGERLLQDIGVDDTIRHEDIPIRHRRPGVARTDLLPPAHLQPVGGKLLQYPGLMPEAILRRAPPPGPVVRPDQGSE